jgi:glycine cleavage system H lipoate-binding protein/TusA-related sulfurtransferase
MIGRYVLLIGHCEFPEEVLYDLENMVWAKPSGDGLLIVGITSTLSSLAGKLTSVRFKETGRRYECGRSIATIESPRFVGAVRMPVDGILAEVNHRVAERPKLANDFPYGKGWLARINPEGTENSVDSLKKVRDIQSELEQQLAQLKVRCFKAFPDYEMYEIGVECAAVLVRLNELMDTMALGEVVHVVSDDPTADIEMERWHDQTGQEVVESRREDGIEHFIVRRAR